MKNRLIMEQIYDNNWREYLENFSENFPDAKIKEKKKKYRFKNKLSSGRKKLEKKWI